jgi:hypothetical protein
LITDSAISGNVASKPGEWGGDGGGIISWAILEIENTTISGNSATGYAGGLVTDHDSSLALNNVTITDNTANSDGACTGSGGGLALKPGAYVTITNSIIAGNHDPLSLVNPITTGAENHPDCYTYSPTEIIPSAGYNLIGITDGCTWLAAPGDLVGTHQTPIDPILSALATGSGETPMHLPLPGSPAIEGGNPATPGGGNGACAGNDQHGKLRPVGVYCDKGAMEYDLGPLTHSLYLPKLSN